MRRASLAPVLALALLAGAVVQPAARAQEGAAFTDGRWVAEAVPVTGGISQEDFGAEFGTTRIDFWMDVTGGAVVAGEMEIHGSISAFADEGSGDFQVDGTVGLTGSARRVVGRGGSLRFCGSISVPDVGPIPIDFEVPGGEGGVGFTPDSADCIQATGDLAVEGRQVQSAAGFSTDVRALFLAIRVPPEVDAVPEDLAETFGELVVDLSAAVSGEPTAAEILDLARRIELLEGAISGLAVCEGSAGGFEEGIVAQDAFFDLFVELMRDVLADPSRFSTQELISLASTAASVGITGESSPDPATGEEILGGFEDALGERLDAAAAATPPDLATIQDIILAAILNGLDDLQARGLEAYRAASG